MEKEKWKEREKKQDIKVHCFFFFYSTEIYFNIQLFCQPKNLVFRVVIKFNKILALV